MVSPTTGPPHSVPEQAVAGAGASVALGGGGWPFPAIGSLKLDWSGIPVVGDGVTLVALSKFPVPRTPTKAAVTAELPPMCPAQSGPLQLAVDARYIPPVAVMEPPPCISRSVLTLSLTALGSFSRLIK